MDEGPVAMNGLDTQSRNGTSGRRHSKSRWFWTLGTVAAVVTVGIAIRVVGVPKAVAQAPIVRPGSPTAPTRPINSTPGPAPAARPAQPAAGSSTPGIAPTPVRP